MMVFALDAARASANSLVPVAKSGISKIPTGPFQRIVLALPISALYCAIVSRPMSTACHPSVMPLPEACAGVFRLCAPAFNFVRLDVVDG